MKKMLISFLVILFFIVYSLLATYPLVTGMEHYVKNLGDPLLNVWILNWDIHKFLTGASNFFDANIFYPDTNTLAYSDHLIAQAVIALPVFLVTREPIFIYNFLFILSFVLSGLGMYCLVFHLTGNRFGAFLSGFIFAFCPFRFGHLGHLQVLTMQWIPFTFLFFHRFIEQNKILDLILLAVFFIFQALSCSYYAFFLSVVILISFIFLILNRKINRKKFLMLVSAGALTGLILFPFFYPYYKFKKEMQFKRNLSEVELYSARPSNYLATPTGNRLLGKLTEKFVSGEAQLFPGITVLLLAVMATFRIKGKKEEGEIKKFRVKFNKILDVFILFNCLLIVVLQKWGGFDFKTALFNVSIHSLRNPVYICVFLVILRWLNSRDRKRFIALSYRGNLYLTLALFSFIFSLGPALLGSDNQKLINLPYLFLYNHIPGFAGLRVPARWGCLVIFSLSVLAGFGVKRVFNSFQKKQTVLKWGTGGLFLALLICESIYIPINYDKVNIETPYFCRWLAEQKGNFSIVELPMPVDASRVYYECMYMYWSIYHWKNLVNGYSGFFPPSYWPMNKVLQQFPNVDSVKLLNALGIKYVIVHFKMIDEEQTGRIKTQLSEFDGSLKIKEKFNGDYIIEVVNSPARVRKESF